MAGKANALAKSFTLEETAHGIPTNAILPANIYTQSIHWFIQSQDNSGISTERHVESYPPSSTQEVGLVALSLASEPSSFLTGIDFLISGGIQLDMGIKDPWQLFCHWSLSELVAAQ